MTSLFSGLMLPTQYATFSGPGIILGFTRSGGDRKGTPLETCLIYVFMVLAYKENGLEAVDRPTSRRSKNVDIGESQLKLRMPR